MKKYLILSLSLFCIYAVTTYSLAQSIPEDAVFGDFDNYEKGDLNEQGGWSDSWNAPLVQDEMVFGGAKALKNQYEFGTAGYKELPSSYLDAGVMSVKMRIDNNSFSDNQDVLGLYKGVGEEYVALVRFAHNFEDRNNMLLISVAGSSDTRELGQITQGEWHKVSLAWRSSDYSIRVKVDNNEWTEWFSSQTTWIGSRAFGEKIALPAAREYGNFYLDDVRSFIGSEEPQNQYDPVLLMEEIEEPVEEEIPPTIEVEEVPVVADPIEEVLPEETPIIPEEVPIEQPVVEPPTEEIPVVEADMDVPETITAEF
jgi:hypothetical protein